MKNLARIVLLLAGLLLLSHYLPAGYWLLADKKVRYPTIFYSCVENRFLFYRFDGQGIQYTDTGGKLYTREEFEPLLPMDNYLQLVRDGKLPKAIHGVPIKPEAIRRERVNLKIKPVFLDSPFIRLTPLFEAENGRVRLEMPNDFMRLGKSIEFIDATSNALVRDKSDRFARAFNNAGFVFPATQVYGNPSTMKPYDEGYFVVDATGTTFQLRQVRGEPEFHRISDFAEDKEKWASLKPRFIFVQEQDSHEVRSLLIDADNRAYLVIGNGYKLVPLPLRHYNPPNMNLVVRGDCFNFLVVASGEGMLESVVLDRCFQVVDRYEEKLPLRDGWTSSKIARAIFPFVINFDNESAGYLGFFLGCGNKAAFAINALFLVVAAVWLKANKQLVRSRIPDLLAVAIGGIYGLITLIVVPNGFD